MDTFLDNLNLLDVFIIFITFIIFFSKLFKIWETMCYYESIVNDTEKCPLYMSIGGEHRLRVHRGVFGGKNDEWK